MIRLLTDLDKPSIMGYISRNEIDTSFLYANVMEFGVDNRPEMRRCADYYGFFQGEELRGILPFYNLGSCIPHYENDAAIPVFADIMKNRDFKFLLGMRNVVEPLYKEIKACKDIIEYDESMYYKNKSLKPFKLDGLKFIDARREIKDEIIDFIVEARKKGFNQVETREEVKKTLVQRSEEEDFIIAQKDGKNVAQACIQTYTPSINQIGSVYTVEEERGKGYAKAVVSEICRRIIKREKTPTLAVVKNNIPAVMAYKALGFEYYDDYLIVKFR